MFAWFNFAHHPLCKNYRNEVFSCNGYFLCKGCTEVYSSGIIIMLFVTLFNPFYSFSVFQFSIIALVTALPSFIGILIHFRRRIIKDFIRIDLGIGLGIAFGEFVIIPDLFSKILIFFILLFIYSFYKTSRSRQNIYHDSNLCSNCRQFNEYACNSYKQVFNTEREYSHLLSDFIQKRLTINKMESMGFDNQTQDD